MPIPRERTLDSSINLLREGYEFIWNRCQRFQSDLFETRLIGRKAICIHGPEAAALFYQESKFERHGALPRRVVTSLFGKGAVHTLDDDAHKQRKAAFLRLMTAANLQRLMDETSGSWRRAIRRWERQNAPVVLFDEAERIFAESVCNWVGVPVPAEDIVQRARDMGSMVDAFGGFGPRLWRGKFARTRAQRWIAAVIEQVRRGTLKADPNSALHVMAHHRDLSGKQLSAKTAAIELLNVIRPTVAIAWYVTFEALALYEHPGARVKIASEPVGEGAGEYADLFMQEVRRFYPFTPYLGAKVRAHFEWKGEDFKPGTLVMLDVYGTHHDPKVWPEPMSFQPERFRTWRGGLYDFMPQGGGRHHAGHRCPGEWITMHHMTLALHYLTRCMTYDVVEKQDLRYPKSRMPTRPRSGFLIQNVRATATLDQPAPRLPSATAARDVAKGDAGTTPSIAVAVA